MLLLLVLLIPGPILWLIAVVISAKSLLKRGHGKAKIALALCYMAFLAEAWSVYHDALLADASHYQRMYNWFGGWWIVVLPLLFAAILLLHLWLYIVGRREHSAG